MKKCARTLCCLLLCALLLPGGGALAGTLRLPDALTAIGSGAFSGDTAVDAVYIPASVTDIADDAFAGTSPVFYLESLDSFARNLDGRGTVHLTRDTVLTGSASFRDASLVVDEGVTLTVNGELSGSRLVVNGTLVNRGTLEVTESISTGAAGLLSIAAAAQTALPLASYAGLRAQGEDGALITLTGAGDPVTTIVTGCCEVEITAGGGKAGVCFVPRISGRYTLTSTGSDDTVAKLYDAQGETLAENDDGGESRNFSITYDLTAGSVYTYEIWFYKSSYTGTVQLLLTPEFRDAAITEQPGNVSAAVGETVVFRVGVGGTAPRCQWQLLPPGETEWADLLGSTDTELRFTADASLDNYQFRCRVTGAHGFAVNSDAVFLRVATDSARCRALLIGEVNFNPVCTRNEGDVNMMRSMLRCARSPGGRYYTVTTGLDLSPDQIHAAIASTFADAASDDVSLFFIATHGDIHEGPGSERAGELYTVDGGAVRFGELAAWLNEVPGKVIVIVESCGSGAAIYANGDAAVYEAGPEADERFAQALIDAFAALEQGQTRGIVSNTGELRVNGKFFVLTASALQQESFGYEYSDASYSYNLFTDWLTEGVGSSGPLPADVQYGDGNGVVTLEELYSYISAVGDGYNIDTGSALVHQTVKRYPEGSAYPLFRR